MNKPFPYKSKKRRSPGGRYPDGFVNKVRKVSLNPNISIRAAEKILGTTAYTIRFCRKIHGIQWVQRIEKIMPGYTRGKITILMDSGIRKNHQVMWLCKCSCGNSVHLKSAQIRAQNKPSCGCEISERARIALLRGPWSGYRVNAKLRKIKFELSFEIFLKMSSRPCFYCGQSPMEFNWNIRDKKRYGKMNGVDRIDSNKGYIIENLVTCCKHCNRAKWEMSTLEFHNWVFKIHSHLSNQNW